MSPYERRRRGNALRDGTRCRPLRGNASKRQRGSRRRADSDEMAERSIDSEQSDYQLVVVELRSKPGERGVYVCQRLSLSPPGKASQRDARVANRTREIRPSGMKTGARGNVTHGETRNPIRNRKSGLGHSSPTGARVPVLSKQSPCPDLERARGGRLPRATRQRASDVR